MFENILFEILDTRTGISERAIFENIPSPCKKTFFLWEKGDMSCDCNRKRFFNAISYRRKLTNSHNYYYPCSKQRFKVRISNADSRVILFDDVSKISKQLSNHISEYLFERDDLVFITSPRNRAISRMLIHDGDFINASFLPMFFNVI